MPVKSDTQLSTASDVIRNETVASANSKTRVADMIQDLVDSKPNIDRIISDTNFANNVNDIPTRGAVASLVAANGSGKKKFVVAIAQANATAIPTGTLLFSSFTGTPVPSRVIAGGYQFTLAGAFPDGKVVVNGCYINIPSVSMFTYIPIKNLGGTDDVANVFFRYVSEDAIQVSFMDPVTGSGIDLFNIGGANYKFVLDIDVYN